MIPLTRLSGSVFALNSDLIERIDATPDTVITLVGGTKYVVAESLPEVISTVRHHRAEVLSLCHVLEALADARPSVAVGAPEAGRPVARRRSLQVVGHDDASEPHDQGRHQGPEVSQ